MQPVIPRLGTRYLVEPSALFVNFLPAFQPSINHPTAQLLVTNCRSSNGSNSVCLHSAFHICPSARWLRSEVGGFPQLCLHLLIFESVYRPGECERLVVGTDTGDIIVVEGGDLKATVPTSGAACGRIECLVAHSKVSLPNHAEPRGTYILVAQGSHCFK
jgi:hypothetical protein